VLFRSYTDSLPALASQAWTSSEHINLARNKYYAIDGVPIVEQTSTTPGAQTFKLTTAVTAIEGVESFGKQIVLTVGPGDINDPPFLKLEDNRISTEQEDQDLIIAPNGTGNIVLEGSPKITGLLDPEDAQDAATKEYVDDTVESRNIVLSMDLSDNQPNSYIINRILNNIAPPAEYRNGTLARILCTRLVNSTTTLDINPLITTQSTEFITPLEPFSTVPGGTAQALTGISVAQATIDAPNFTTIRIIKTFQIFNGAWQHQFDEALPSS
jgi:hypothetical protein